MRAWQNLRADLCTVCILIILFSCSMVLAFAEWHSSDTSKSLHMAYMSYQIRGYESPPTSFRFFTMCRGGFEATKAFLRRDYSWSKPGVSPGMGVSG